MEREAWQATVHGVVKESDMAKQLNKNLSAHGNDIMGCYAIWLPET